MSPSFFCRSMGLDWIGLIDGVLFRKVTVRDVCPRFSPNLRFLPADTCAFYCVPDALIVISSDRNDYPHPTLTEYNLRHCFQCNGWIKQEVSLTKPSSFACLPSDMRSNCIIVIYPPLINKLGFSANSSNITCFLLVPFFGSFSVPHLKVLQSPSAANG